MQEEAEALNKSLVQSFGEAIRYAYVDVLSSEMNNYPEIAQILNRVRLPLIVLNGQPRFHGGISKEVIADAVGDLAK
ncbi:MAG TPA: hypothetical protein DCK76_06700 [Desulfotomaculum sp.]|nr:MAG: hypothetical protein XD84_1270 [Desulfotomaculum sp. 46_80]HAG11060.1 hypothetical protein [Desulfotomaculum sp.]HBY03626.1 hypothetical protein [Desulfotomaculum sp.]